VAKNVKPKKILSYIVCALVIFVVACGPTEIERDDIYIPEEIVEIEPPYEPEEIDLCEEIEEPGEPDFSAYPQFHLTILHTNDWHGNLDNVPMYATLVREIRAERDNVLLLDGGDIYRRGPLQELRGAAEIAVMNAMGYDALVFGNNEFPRTNDVMFNISDHPILHLAEFPVLLANATLDGEYIAGLEPYIIVEMEDVEVAIIGVTSPKPWDRNYDFTERYSFECPVISLARYVEKVGEYSDIQIALSHAGIVLDLRMRGVSAIIGGDSHRILREPIVLHDGDRLIPVVQAGGERYHYLGQLDLYFAEIDGEWILFEFYGRLLCIEDVEPCAEILEIIEYFTALVRG